MTKPAFKLLANSKDITATIQDRFESLRLTDEAGFQADMLEVKLNDSDPANEIAIPPTGAELELWLGYGEKLTKMGLYVVDEVELAGWPSMMTIRARAAPYEQTPLGKVDLQSQKARSWPNGTKLGAMVEKIAKEHGMQAVVAKSVASITLPHFDQTEESDISFLIRVTKQYDVLIKPAGGKLVAIARGSAESANGEKLPIINIDATELRDYHLSMSTKESAGTVVAYWHSTKQSKRIEITVGSGEPVKRLRHFYPTEEAARKAAQGEQAKRKRGQHKLTVSTVGNPAMQAEALLNITGVRSGVDGEWLMSRVEHAIDANGYISSMDCEIPNKNE